MSLLAPDLLSTAEEDVFCPYSPRLMGMGGPFQAWVPWIDLSVDKLPESTDKMNGLCKSTSF